MEYNLSPELSPAEDTVLFEKGEHKVIYLGSRDITDNVGVGVLSYLIINRNEGMIVDPGGYHLFPKTIFNISKYIPVERIKYIYFCHQDPDVCGSLPMWRDVCPDAKIVIGELWVRFLPHFGVENVDEIALPLPKDGGTINLGSCPIEAIPAHYMHSPNHFSLYDPISKFLFTGDIGIALGNFNYLVVKDWLEHLDYIYTPHRILIGSNKVARDWVERVRKLEVKAILPQHGAIIPEDMVKYFLKFMENLKCGIDLL